MDDGGLQLNICTNATSALPKRKKVKAEEFDDKTQSTSKKKASQLDVTDSEKKKERHSKVPLKKSSLPSSGEIVSSLFNGNPFCPKINRNAIEPIKEEIFVPESFDHLPLHQFMISNLESSFEVKSMTVVQKEAIPPILEGKDVLVKSQTGSGKTLAFAVPIIHRLQEVRPKIQRSDGIACVIVVPTRELAIQSYECFVKLLKPFTWIVPGCLMGGEKKKSEKSRIRKGLNILISTPGRLVDHLNSTKNLLLEKVKWLVIDEADRMLDMGYERDLSTIIDSLNNSVKEKRQTILLSATLSSGVEQLAGLTLNNPEIIDISACKEEQPLGHLVIPQRLRQSYVVVPMKLRLVTLAAFILWKCKFSNERKILIFMSSQDMVDFHAQLLIQILRKVLRQQDKLLSLDKTSEEDVDEEMDENEDALGIFKLHGNMAQKERSHVFLRVKEASAAVLICTDVAARGLDLPHVHWIVQYNAPLRPVDYVHRVGRTARIGSSGDALLFLLPSEVGYVKTMEQEHISLEEVKAESILEKLTLAIVSTTTGTKGKRTKVATTMEESATALQLRFENAVLNDYELKELARKAFVSYVRSYASYPSSMRHVFDLKSVHLGHVAKSLGLRENPSAVGASTSSTFKATDRRKRSRIVGGAPRQVVSEFASGLDDLPPPPPKKKKHRRP